MMRQIRLQDGDVRRGLVAFLRDLLAQSDIDAVFTPIRKSSGAITHALVTEPDLLDHADPLAPILPLNGASLVARLGTQAGRIAALVRPCEARALVELAKLKQVNLDAIILIGMDCLGTYSLADYMSGAREPLPAGIQTGELAPLPAYAFRDACQMCEYFTPPSAVDIAIHLLGVDLAEGIPLDLPEHLAGLPCLGEGADSPDRERAIETLRTSRTAQRDANFEDVHYRAQADGGLEGIFQACIQCMNCQQVCPLCYCKLCIFRGNLFDHTPEKLLAWSERGGALAMPVDTMLFHLTRLSHMAVTCVGCGMCTEACPADIPVGQVFRSIGGDTQAVFGYIPGDDLDTAIPLITFQEDEWNEVGEG